VSRVSHRIDRIDTTFDNPNLAPDAGLILAATVMVRLGLEALINSWVRTGSARPGGKALTVVSAMLAGATHIDHVDVLRAGATAGVLPHQVMAPSTVGTFLRSFTFGHVRQLDAVACRALARAWQLSAGPAPGESMVVDLDSTICEVHGKHKQGAAYAPTSPAIKPNGGSRLGEARDWADDEEEPMRLPSNNFCTRPACAAGSPGCPWYSTSPSTPLSARRPATDVDRVHLLRQPEQPGEPGVQAAISGPVRIWWTTGDQHDRGCLRGRSRGDAGRRRCRRLGSDGHR
jgi:hypothetical protein